MSMRVRMIVMMCHDDFTVSDGLFILFQTFLKIFQHIQLETAESSTFPSFDIDVAAEYKHIVTRNQTAEQGDRFQTALTTKMLIPMIADGDMPYFIAINNNPTTSQVSTVRRAVPLFARIPGVTSKPRASNTRGTKAMRNKGS